MQLLHFILKCNHLEWRWLFGPFKIYINTNCLFFVLKLQRTPFKGFTSRLLKLSFSRSMHQLPRMNVMLDFIWTLPVQLWGTFIRGNRCIEREKDNSKSREVKHLKECALALIISIPGEELFFETTTGCNASNFVKIIRYCRLFCNPPSYFEDVYCLMWSPKGGFCSISNDVFCYNNDLHLRKIYMFYTYGFHVWKSFNTPNRSSIGYTWKHGVIIKFGKSWEKWSTSCVYLCNK